MPFLFHVTTHLKPHCHRREDVVINDAKIAHIIFSHVRLTFFSFHMASETETPTVRERKRQS